MAKILAHCESPFGYCQVANFLSRFTIQYNKLDNTMTRLRHIRLLLFLVAYSSFGTVAFAIDCSWNGGIAGTWFDPLDPVPFATDPLEAANSDWDCNPGSIEIAGITYNAIMYPNIPSPLGPFFSAEIDSPAAIVVPPILPIRITDLQMSSGLATVVLVDGSSFGIADPDNNGTVNGGRIEIGSLGIGSASFTVDGRVRLMGGGEISLGESTGNRIIGSGAVNVASPTLVIEDYTIRGAGQLGADVLNIQNMPNGLIEANSSSVELVVDPGIGNNIINSGTMQAVDGGTLRIRQTGVANAGGLIQANGGTVILRDTTVSNGTLSTDANGVIQNIATVTLEGPMVNQGNYQVTNGARTIIDGQVANHGNIHLNATAPSPGQFGNTVLTVMDNWTLDHGGSITMSNFNANRIVSSEGGAKLLDVKDHTISGSGLLLFLKVNNEGVFRANQSEPFVLLPSDGAMDAFVNKNLVEAVDGGTMVFRISDFDNSSGRVQAIDSNLEIIDSATIHGGVVDLIGASNLKLQHGTIQNKDSQTATTTIGENASVTTMFGGLNRLSGTVDNQGVIDISDNSDLAFDTNGTYLNKNRISLNGEGPYVSFADTSLVMEGHVELSGGGEIVMSNTNDNVITTFTPGSVFVNVDNFIHGGGQIGRNVLSVINNATISVDVASDGQAHTGLLVLDPIGNEAGQNFVNNGTLKAEKGGRLLFLHGGYDNRNGIISAEDNSVVSFDQAVTVTGGQITSSGSGRVNVDREVEFDGVGIELDADIRVTEIGTLRLVGDITNKRSIELMPGAGQMRILGSVTLDGGGTIKMNDITNSIRAAASSTIDNVTNLDNAIEGAGFISVAFTNRNTISANIPNERLTIDPAGPGELFDNDGGTLQAVDGGILRLRPGTFANGDGGVIQSLAGSVVELDNVLTIEGGVIAGLDGIVRAQGGGLTGTSLKNVTLLGQYQIAPFGATTLVEQVTNRAQIVLGAPNGQQSSALRWQGDVFLDGGGEIVLSDSQLHQLSGFQVSSVLTNEDNTIRGAGRIQGAIVNNGIVRSLGGLLTILPQGNGFSNHGRLETVSDMEIRFGGFSNDGEVVIANNTTLNRLGDYEQTGGSTVVDGVLNVSGELQLLGGTLTGGGQIAGSVVNSGSSVSPGNSPGILNVDNYTQGENGTLNIELQGTESGDFDQLVVSGSVDLSGILEVNLLPGLEVDAGATFDFLLANNLSGEFNQIQIPVNANGQPVLELTSIANGLRLTSLEPLFVELLDGDFNLDGNVDLDDLDVLTNQVNSASGDLDFDVNGDGALSFADRVFWLEEIANTFVGDSNFDGQFDSSDMIRAFQSGEYEDSIPNNSTWQEGDWNGNGDFESGDLILAFQRGGYESGPRMSLASATTVPEPTGLSTLFLAAFFTLASLRKGCQRCKK